MVFESKPFEEYKKVFDAEEKFIEDPLVHDLTYFPLHGLQVYLPLNKCLLTSCLAHFFGTTFGAIFPPLTSCSARSQCNECKKPPRSRTALSAVGFPACLRVCRRCEHIPIQKGITVPELFLIVKEG